MDEINENLEIMAFPFPHLPRQLQSKIGKEVSQAIINRLHYLWSTSLLLIQKSIQLSHQLTKSFNRVINEYGIVLPEDIIRQMCCKCYVIQIPNVTCKTSTEVKKKKKKLSSSTNEKSNDVKIKLLLNKSLVRYCLLCKERNYKCEKYNKPPAHRPKSAKVLSNTTADSTYNNIVKPKKFSFLEKISTSNQTNDFIAFSPTKTSNYADMKILTEPKKHLTLLEREKLNKSLKKRKLSLPNTLISTSETSISSLQYLFNQNK